MCAWVDGICMTMAVFHWELFVKQAFVNNVDRDRNGC